jgi:hypothetical protein
MGASNAPSPTASLMDTVGVDADTDLHLLAQGPRALQHEAFQLAIRLSSGLNDLIHSFRHFLYDSSWLHLSLLHSS